MKTNLIGRVTVNTALSFRHALLPVLEAITNSIDAIEDASRTAGAGRIEVYIKRNKTLELQDLDSEQEDTRIHGSFYSFEIHDNGIGFTGENYESFTVADSLYKQRRGGKGVGRFTWLRAFEKAEIDSVFCCDGKLFRRQFTFSLANEDGITNIHVEEVAPETKTETIVRLIGIKKDYEKNVPRSALTIAERFVEHFVEYYVLSKMPEVVIYDDDEEEPVFLDALAEELLGQHDSAIINIGNYEFEIVHLLLRARANSRHRICLCANRRVVDTVVLSNGKVSNLPTTLIRPESEDGFVYAGYVSSTYLNKHVNQSRTGFDTFPDGGFKPEGEPTREEIEREVISGSRAFLLPFTELVKEKKEQEIHEYVNNHAPEYRYLVNKHPEILDDIPNGLSSKELDTKLYERQRDLDAQARDAALEIFEHEPEDLDEIQQWEEDVSRCLEEVNEIGKANLAKYITHRKLMLKLFEKALCRQATGSYSLEDAVHKLIFPMRTTSDEITYDKHNLWIIDEKLSYHRYAASDMKLRKMEPIESDSDNRPDILLIFDKPIAVVEDEYPYGSGVVIFEFKRPLRDDYNREKNPIQQVINYVMDIREGQVCDRRGRPFSVPKNTPFYCYIVCDPSSTLDRVIAMEPYLLEMPDGNGYFGYHNKAGAYVELISYEKLLQDAKKRNRVLFDRLNLPE